MVHSQVLLLISCLTTLGAARIPTAVSSAFEIVCPPAVNQQWWKTVDCTCKHAGPRGLRCKAKPDALQPSAGPSSYSLPSEVETTCRCEEIPSPLPAYEPKQRPPSYQEECKGKGKGPAGKGKKPKGKCNLMKRDAIPEAMAEAGALGAAGPSGAATGAKLTKLTCPPKLKSKCLGGGDVRCECYPSIPNSPHPYCSPGVGTNWDGMVAVGKDPTIACEKECECIDPNQTKAKPQNPSAWASGVDWKKGKKDKGAAVKRDAIPEAMAEAEAEADPWAEADAEAWFDRYEDGDDFEDLF